MAKADKKSNTEWILLGEAYARLVKHYGTPDWVKILIREEIVAGRMQWRCERKRGGDCELWQSQPRLGQSRPDINFENSSAVHKGDRRRQPRTEWFSISVSRARVEALLSEGPSESGKVGPGRPKGRPKERPKPQIRRGQPVLKKLYPPDGEVPDDIPTETVRAQINTELADENRIKGLADLSWDSVNRMLGRAPA